METKRPMKTQVLPGALAAVVTTAMLGVFSRAGHLSLHWRKSI